MIKGSVLEVFGLRRPSGIPAELLHCSFRHALKFRRKIQTKKYTLRFINVHMVPKVMGLENT